ncbi:MAG: DUF3795 domain-containing protein [Candidatus Zixiibacteriota bacterium]|nr:MAG: DUF3795 domain-containing protein [candidate division Zixibacteria bacterium]
MEEMIGYCGYNCHLCAARSDDPVVRQKLVDGWRKIFGHQNYTAENVKCDGCRNNGRLADKGCKARPCAIERKVDSCAYCNDFICDRIRHLLAGREGMLTFLHSRLASLTEEEYDLCARQFESMPNLIRLLVKAEKLPSWLAEKPEALKESG